MLLGLARGKVGDLVFYRDGGEQRTRTRVVPKNPRTLAQMAQRVKIANVSALYRALSGVLSESFTNRLTKHSGYNAFASMAINLAPYQTKAMAAADVVLPQPAFASKGVLPTIPLTGEFTEGRPFGVGDIGTSITSSSTIAQLSARLVDLYPGLNYGDKLTFVGMRFMASDIDVEGVDVYVPQVAVDVLELSSSNQNTLADSGFSVSDSVLGTNMFITLSEDEIGMASVIHSRVNGNGQLETSSQMFHLTPSAQSLYEGYRTQQSLDDAVQSYMAGGESILR